MSRRKLRAFSLLELSIVIVIIGILLIGIIGSKHIIAKSRLTTAMAMTRSSPINGTLNNKLWLESSLAEISLGENLATGDAITSWIDNSSNKTSISISAVGDGATYANTINHVQAVKFGSSSNLHHLQIDDAAFLNGTDYTIFITEKRISTNGSTGNYLLGGATDSFALGYESGTTMIQTHGEAADADNQASIEALSSYSNKPRTIVFTHSSTDGNKIYINGTLANEDTTSTAKAHLSGITTLAIGNNYNGEIGEIAIFDRDLKTVERREIEDYMTDKWNSPNNRDSSASCTSGTILSTGCEASCSAPSVTGITSSSTISDGGSGSYSCDATGYNGSTPTYTCSSGTLSPTPASSDCTDNGCATDYNVDSGTCKAKCTVTSQTGITDGTKVNSGSTSLSCNATGYTGTITYTCDDGTLNVSSNDCTGITTCDLDAENIPGVTQTGTVSEGTSTLTCDDTGYDGQTISYICSGGVFSDVGTCGCNVPLYFADGSNCVDASAVAWLDASDSSSITHSSNSVSQWNDKSGNANHLTQGTSSRQPTTNSTTQNGLNVIDFDGTDDSLNFTSNIDFMNASFFAVVKENSSGIQQIFSNSSTLNVQLRVEIDNTLGVAAVNNRWLGNSLGKVTSTGTVSAGFNVVGFIGDNKLKFVMNGSSEESTETRINTNPVYYNAVGARNVTYEVLNGSIAEIVIYNKVLSDSEINSLRTYLNNKWSVY